MILNAIYTLVYKFLLVVVGWLQGLGTVSTDNNISNSIVSFKSYYIALNGLLPVDTMLQIVTFVMVVEGSILTYKAIKWAYSKIPGVN